jgi:hypothetical protein
MAKKDVALFIESVSKQASLSQELSQAGPTLGAWTRVAEKAGFGFSEDDLHAVLERLLDRKVPGDAVVSEFLSAQSELDTEQLDQVVGGTAAAGGFVAVSPATLQRVAGLGAGTHASEWGLHVKGPFSGGQNERGQ